MKKRTQILISMYLFAVVLTPLVLFALGLRSGEIENRTLVAFPESDITSLADEKWFQQAADYYEDRLPGRAAAVAADAWVDYRIASDTPVPQVTLGTDGWMFTTGAFTLPCDETADPELVAATLDEMVRVIVASDREAVALVAPNKSSIYPEYASNVPDLSCSLAARDAMQSEIELRHIPGYLDMWGFLDSLKTTGEIQVYNPFDTHWNPEVSVEVSQAIVDAIDPSVWDPAAVGERQYETKDGELPDVMGLPETVDVPRRRVSRTDATVNRLDDNDRYGPNEYTVEPNIPVVPGVMFMVHDSFGNGLEPILSQFFADSTYLHWRAILNAPAQAGATFGRHVADADLIVIESVERLLFQRFGLELLAFPDHMVAALVDDLPADQVDADEFLEMGIASLDANLNDSTRRYLVLEFDSGAGLRLPTVTDGTRNDRWIPRQGPLRVAWDVTDVETIRFIEELPPVLSVRVVSVDMTASP